MLTWTIEWVIPLAFSNIIWRTRVQRSNSSWLVYIVSPIYTGKSTWRPKASTKPFIEFADKHARANEPSRVILGIGLSYFSCCFKSHVRVSDIWHCAPWIMAFSKINQTSFCSIISYIFLQETPIVRLFHMSLLNLPHRTPKYVGHIFKRHSRPHYHPWE